MAGHKLGLLLHGGLEPHFQYLCHGLVVLPSSAPQQRLVGGVSDEIVFEYECGF